MSDARNFSVRDALRSGTPITIRAIRPDDRERLIEAFRGLERESIYTRFFGYRRELHGDELARLDLMDFVHEVMLVATVMEAGRERVIGSCRYVGLGASEPQSTAAQSTAEVAFTVEEDFQGQGLASKLLRNLAAIARGNGYARLEADVLAENKGMRAVFERSGFPMQTRYEEGCVHVTMDLVASA
jgi:RimJ/RimL family protein N-acetyltransferase